ncbi:MAG: EamA family transporter RarD [Gammaproteobacteria bacterium]|nr:EamA family transporter RarD [Gammaproteobacteria bacterium]
MNKELNGSAARVERGGVIAAVLAFGMWGMLPVYFIIVAEVSATEMLAHRVIWAVPFGAVILWARRQWPEVRAAIRVPTSLALLALSATFIAVNWFGYIWAVQNQQIFQASLGYYINPLMYVLAGFVILGERLRTFQLLAVALAAVGVGVLTVSGGQFPAIAILVAVSFTLYGVIRKQIDVGAMPGLFIETVLLLPLCAGYLIWLLRSGHAAFSLADPTMFALLLLAGPVTVVPLLLFAVAARRLRLSTIGFLQFIAPTGQFIIGVVHGEPLTLAHLVCFAFIWTALSVFLYDAWRNSRKLPVAV